MAEAASSNKMFTNSVSFGDSDNKAESSSRHASDIERKGIPSNASLEKMTDGGSSHEHVDQIDEWAASLERLLEDVPSYMCSTGHPGRITRIPENLREPNLKAYEPYILSIGPYHNGKPRMKRMEMTKQLILKCVLKQKPEITLKDYLMELRSIEPAVRSFYSGIEMENQKFMHMLLLDCMFILLQFCGIPVSQERANNRNTGTESRVVIEDMNERAEQITEGEEIGSDNQNIHMVATVDELNSEASNSDNYAVATAWFWASFTHDLFLLENQLPFFVLQKIHDLAYGNSKTALIDIMKYHIGKMVLVYTKLDSKMVISPHEEVHHLLHLCHMFFRPTLQQELISFQVTESNPMFRLGSAVQLYEAGVKFEARSDSTEHSLLDITFGNSGIMVMPCLYVDDNTDSLLRNLISLEQMKYPRLGLDVSAYAVLLLHLVTTPADVKLLRRKGIIEHHLASDKEMMYLINRLSVGLAFDYVEDRYRLKPVFQELKRYTERKVPGWKAWLKHRYFSNPWTVISLMAASLLLLLTSVQTFYTMYSYYR